jgi:hypothetical protein
VLVILIEKVGRLADDSKKISLHFRGFLV